MTGRLLLLALLAVTVVPAGARAATYDVWSCRGPDGTPVATTAWHPFGTVPAETTRTDTCATGGALTARLSGSEAEGSDGAFTGFRFATPNGVAPVRWAVEVAGSASGDASVTGEYQAGLAVGPDPLTGGVTDGCTADHGCTFGDPSVPLAPANARSGVLSPGDVLALAADCRSSGTACAAAATPAATTSLFRSRVTFDDRTAPQLGPLGGSASASGAQRGRRSVTAAVSDGGGGVHRTELLVDGVVVATQAGEGRCAVPFTTPVPCPDAITARFELDLDALVPGTHRVVVHAYDAALNAAASAPLDVTVASPPAAPAGPVAPPGPPPAADGRIALSHARLRPGGRTVAGTVFDARGTPLGGVALRFERRPFGGDAGDWRLIGTATSGPDGRFTVPAIATSGEVRALRAGSGGDVVAPVAFVAPLSVAVRAADRTLRNGERLTLTGTVRGDGGAFEGRRVLVQALVRGRWRTVDDVDVAARGQVRWTYRFTTTRRPARYRFRLVLPATKRLPWQRTASGSVGVLVRPR